MQKKKFFNTRDLVLASLFIALSIVFARLFGIKISDGLRLSFGQTPIILSGILLGPIWGLIVGALADVVGFAVAPLGAYIPGLTLTSALVGFIPGLIYKYVFKKNMAIAIVVSVIIDMLLVNGLLATWFLSLVYSKRSFMVWLSTRIPVELVMCVVHPLVIIPLAAALKKTVYKDKPQSIQKA